MNLIKSINKNKLLFNSLNLMIATGISAAFGFIFWIIVAHSFKTEIVGLATSVLSITSLLSLLGLSGFDSVFVRFLANSKDRNSQINSGLLIAGIITTIIAGIFCLFVPYFSPRISFINNNIINQFIFVAVTVLMTWNTLTNAIFVAYRKTSFILTINIIFSILKIVLPLLFTHGGAIAIIEIIGIVQLTNLLLSILILTKYFNYVPSIKVNFKIIQETLKYNILVYITNIINLLPDSILPLIVINYLGAVSAAYFFISFSIANLIYTIAFSTNQVLLAETSYDENNYSKHALNGLRIIIALLMPTIILVFLLSPIILSIFGKNYAGALIILRILCISGFAVMFYSFLNFIFKQTKNLKAMLFITIVNAVSIITLSIFWVKHYGLEGIGWAWLIGTCVAVISSSVFILPFKSIIQSYKNLFLLKRLNI